jgi:hypothetical protein
MYYYITPNYNVALNAKVGSSTLAREIIRQYYPEQNKKIIYTKTPSHVLENDKQWHWLCPGTNDPDKPIVLFIRDPISRFISACQQIGITKYDLTNVIDSLLNDTYFIREPKIEMLRRDRNEQIKNIDHLNIKRLEQRNDRITENKKVRAKFRRIGFIRDDIHFWHQYKYINNEAYCFKFPEHFILGLQFMGLDTECIPMVNVAKREKLVISQENINSVSNYYKQDIELFNLITEPGKLIRAQGEVLCH